MELGQQPHLALYTVYRQVLLAKLDWQTLQGDHFDVKFTKIVVDVTYAAT